MSDLNSNDDRLFMGLFYAGNVIMFLGFAWVFLLNATGNFQSGWMAGAVFTIWLGVMLALGSGRLRLISFGVFVASWTLCYLCIEFVKHAAGT